LWQWKGDTAKTASASTFNLPCIRLSDVVSHPRELNSSNTASRAAVLKSAVENASLAESLSGIGWGLLDGIDGMDDIHDESNYVDVDVDSIFDDIGQFPVEDAG